MPHRGQAVGPGDKLWNQGECGAAGHICLASCKAPSLRQGQAWPRKRQPRHLWPRASPPLVVLRLTRGTRRADSKLTPLPGPSTRRSLWQNMHDTWSQNMAPCGSAWSACLSGGLERGVQRGYRLGHHHRIAWHRRRGLFALKKKNGGKFPVTAKKAAPAAKATKAPRCALQTPQPAMLAACTRCMPCGRRHERVM